MMTLDEWIAKAIDKADVCARRAEHCTDDQDWVSFQLEWEENFNVLADMLMELKAYRDGGDCSNCRFKDASNLSYPCMSCDDKYCEWEYGGRKYDDK